MAAKTASVQPSGLTGQAGLVQLRDEYSKRERELQKKIKIGQRILVQTKTSSECFLPLQKVSTGSSDSLSLSPPPPPPPISCSVYDLEPQKLTGIVKFVGKIDSEFIDNRIYVGLKLDEPSELF